jgi:alkylation response protein AidB-like acyl-CoA dehydrogenase
MYFLPTKDQLDLQRGVRELLDARFPLERLPGGFDPELWRALIDTGCFTLRTDLELGVTDAVLVFEELGRAAVVGPLVGSFLVGGSFGGTVTVIDPTRQPILVAHLDVATALLVLAADGPMLVRTADLAVAAARVSDPLDPLTPLHELAGLPTGSATATPLSINAARLHAEGAVMTAALQVGLAARMTELAVDYAKSREQFGKIIGSFQAVKHLCADMFVRTELARAALHSAAVMLDDSEGLDDAAVARAVAGAKLLADEAATTNGRSCVQIHGGMGFTWEVPVHYLVKRAWLHATEFGTAEEHAEDLAGLL